MARAWGCKPWELTGEEFCPWTLLVWETRFVLYENEQIEKQQRELEELKNR